MVTPCDERAREGDENEKENEEERDEECEREQGLARHELDSAPSRCWRTRTNPSFQRHLANFGRNKSVFASARSRADTRADHLERGRLPGRMEHRLRRAPAPTRSPLVGSASAKVWTIEDGSMFAMPARSALASGFAVATPQSHERHSVIVTPVRRPLVVRDGR